MKQTQLPENRGTLKYKGNPILFCMKHDFSPNESGSTEFTAEQEAEIQKRIVADREREHRAIAGDRFYRLGVAAAVQSVQAGMDDPEVIRVGQREWERFSKENPVLGRKVETVKKPEKVEE
jgi:glutamate/tyrosine decarboxylase-like PLP-dependent enzyme